MRDKRIYNKTIAISEKDLKYIRDLKIKFGNKKSLAGVLSFIIDFFRDKKQNKLF